MRKQSIKQLKWLERIPNLFNISEHKAFAIRWYKNIIKGIESAIESSMESENKSKKPANIVSRSDLSRTRPTVELDKLMKDNDVTLANKGFYGTPLPLIPDIRKSEVSEGAVGILLDAFGVSKRFERVVTLTQGPNKRSNRYLVFQYKRLIKSIDGTIVKGNKNTLAHVNWMHNFYNLSSPTSGLSSKDRKNLRAKARSYWVIAVQLLRTSLAFRMALIKKSMGKTGRWFHRDFDIEDLFSINQMYQEIADKFSSKIKIKRVWINQEQRDKSFKWRPLGTSPWPWRVYTRGINNLLETFISGSWPDNQHGYKTGRGVHTVWNQVLRKIIHAKFIFEFDFAGFFNTVRIEAVGNTLHRLYVPKYMIAYLVNISSAEVENIGIIDALSNLTTEDPTKQGWAKAWTKYEFIHKYRRNYRSTGLPQGFALSPLLSVITLIVLEELNEKFKNVMYCDDGIFYSDKKFSFLDEAQTILDKHGVGAYFNKSKSVAIKEDGVWLNKLKFVGLVYDPFTDDLSASTRNGATITLKIRALGIFTPIAWIAEELKIWAERDHSDWIISNERLFLLYERIFLLEGFTTDYKIELYKNLSTVTISIIKRRLLKYSLHDLSEVARSGYESNLLVDFIYPMAILKHIDKDQFFELVLKYENIIGEFPYHAIAEINDSYIWMHQEYTLGKYETLLKDKLLEQKELHPGDRFIQTTNVDPISEKNNPAELILDQLHWFQQLDSPPESLASILNDGHIGIGQWYELALKDLDETKIPVYVKRHIETYGGKFGYTEVTWRNLYKDPVFATFIAKLFQNSFRSGVIKQNFRLTTDRTKLTLVKIIDRFIGRNKFDSVGVKFDIFNSSSYCSNLFYHIMLSWKPWIKSRKVLSPIDTSYNDIKIKIANRRSDVDLFYKRLFTFEEAYAVYTSEGCKWVSNKPKIKLTDEEKSLLFDYPLISYINNVTKKHRISSKHITNKLAKVKTLHIKAITRSPISTHEIHSEMFSNPRCEAIYPFTGIKWDTLEPKRKVKEYLVKI
jgi:hypothetical protein